VAALVLLTPTPGTSALVIGSPAPDFDTVTVEGRHFSLAEAKRSHRAIVVLFLSTLCPYSNYYNDLLRDMSAEFGRRASCSSGSTAAASKR